jgi:hypothetical protein
MTPAASKFGFRAYHQTREYLLKSSKVREEKGMVRFSNDDIEDIIARNGCRPADLHDLATSPLPPKENVTNRINREKNRIYALLLEDPKYALVLSTPLERDCINERELMDILKQPTKKIAKVAMAEVHVLSFDPVADSVQFHSVAMREAARLWKAEEDEKLEAARLWKAEEDAKWFGQR